MVLVALLTVAGWTAAQEPAPAATPAQAAAPPAAAPTTAPPAEVKAPAVYLKAMRIQLDGKAAFAGNVQMEFMPQGQAAKLVSVDVIPKMKADEIARDIYKQLTLAAGSNYKVKQSKDRITIKRANSKVPNFSLTITNQSVLGVSFLIEED
jgi:hypothetical protein